MLELETRHSFHFSPSHYFLRCENEKFFLLPFVNVDSPRHVNYAKKYIYTTGRKVESSTLKLTHVAILLLDGKHKNTIHICWMKLFRNIRKKIESYSKGSIQLSMKATFEHTQKKKDHFIIHVRKLSCYDTKQSYVRESNVVG